jgi:MerR family transcriptional regulator/heat shock protein HspR
MQERIPEDEPCYVISVAAKMLGMHQQTLRYYERVGIIVPSRSGGNIRLYSQSDINRLRQVKRLIDDLGINLAGAEVILQMNARIRQLEAEMNTLRAELEEQRKAASRRRLTAGQRQ